MALGFFDGFHLGHQEIARAAVTRARQSGLTPAVFTFRNHPGTVVDCRRAPTLLTTFEERVDRLLGFGADVVWCDFDRPFSQLEPRAFVEDILVEGVGARWVAAGPNYRFGHRAAGDIELLKRLGDGAGFGVEIAQPVVLEGELVSSSRIRALVMDGDVSAAADLMGRPYAVRALVERGAARGRTLGFPTANLTVPPRKVVPAAGVYAVRVEHEGVGRPGVANLGVRPTFGEERLVLEVHLIDFSGDLYGDRLKVEFMHRLRGEQRFPGVDALRGQIAADLEAARDLLS